MNDEETRNEIRKFIVQLSEAVFQPFFSRILKEIKLINDKISIVESIKDENDYFYSTKLEPYLKHIAETEKNIYEKYCELSEKIKGDVDERDGEFDIDQLFDC